ncbi:MAG: hypothetical protein JWO05_2975 [Gemmatimonadetes bacterium]|nr:hypothetical protein [Gemmatimonadota bacterium]
MRTPSRTTLALAAATSLLASAACGSSSSATTDATGNGIASVKVSAVLTNINVGSTTTVTLRSYSASGALLAVVANPTWSSNDATVATVDGTGKVSGIKAGSTYIKGSTTGSTGGIVRDSVQVTVGSATPGL